MIHNKHDKLIIVGAGGHGKVCIDIAEQMDVWEEIKVIDDNKNGTVLNKEIIGTNKLIDSDLVETCDFFVGIGDNKIRKYFMEKILRQEGNMVNLISPHAILSQYTILGVGNVLMPLSVVNTSAVIGDGNIINTSAIVEHDVELKNFNHISPGSILLGNAKVGNNNWIGSNSTTKESCSIQNENIIGANSFLKDNIKCNKNVRGVPGIEY